MPWPFVPATSADGRIELRLPVIVMVLAATAIPIELRAPVSWSGFALSRNLAIDALANVIGYLPVGLVLRDFGVLRGLAIAAVMAYLAEAAQLVIAHRDPSLMDVTSNAVGAALGLMIAARWDIRTLSLALGPVTAGLAALVAVATLAGVWMVRGGPPSARGLTLPGRLEAQWKLDEPSGRRAADSSGQGLAGTYSVEPRRTEEPEGASGPAGRVPLFDGEGASIDAGSPTALRLAGSMTISAWIKPVAYPADDAAIVSSYDGVGQGFQLDATPDRGPRTIGFKLSDTCGRLTARYGATPLRLNVWHHVAGVYDAEARTLDVYWNGRLNNGFLDGTVTGMQRPSRASVAIARRSGEAGFDFIGAIRDVRIYSRALGMGEIGAVMRGEVADLSGGGARPTPVARPAPLPPGPALPLACRLASDHADRHLPIAAAALGLLVTLAGVALWPASRKMMLLWLAVSLAAGALLPTARLPAMNLWLLPLTSLFGCAAVLLALRTTARVEPPLFRRLVMPLRRSHPGGP